jgi:hypothetical protein
MSEFLHPEIVENRPNPELLTKTLDVGSEFAHINASSEVLRNNLIAEAIKQGIAEATAKEYAANSQFSFQTSGEFFANRARAETSAFKSLRHQALSVLRHNDVYGMVDKKGDGKFACTISVETVAKGVKKRYRHSSQEVRDVALVQEIDAIWRHERQHLIQYMSPEKRQQMKRTILLHKLGLLAGAGGLGASVVGLNLLPDISASTKEDLLLLSVTSAYGLIANTVYRARMSPPEREAYAKMKPEHYTRNSPFQITFEQERHQQSTT